tara:strand:- start:15981 stop:16154 length:174 start_codon:yes stop_codon:yes gene_type:complete
MELKIEDFREFLEMTDRMHEDEELNIFLKTCINSLWIMHEQGNRMATKTLLELKNYL